MTADEARKAAPTMGTALKIYEPSSPEAKWLPVGAAKGQIRVLKWGVDMIELVYPSEATAKKTLETAWGKPTLGDSAFRWHLWTNPTAGIRATLMPGNENKLTRLELLPYRPLAELASDGFELAFKGAHLLDAKPEALTSIARSREDTDFQLLPTELSSGHIPMHVTIRDAAIVNYTIGVDFTYDKPVRETVENAVIAHFGKGTKIPAPLFSSKVCTAFPPTTSGVHARACVILTQWQITIARSAEALDAT